jgi:hypothetical protein
MSARAEPAAAVGPGVASARPRAPGLAEGTLGPAMHLMLTLAAARTEADALPGARQDIQSLWDLAERYHPEQAWLAASWLRNERTIDELERCAPREGLAPGLRAHLSGSQRQAHELRREPPFAQE